MEFKDLKLIPQLLKAVEHEGYDVPSPVQEAAIPPALEGRDVLGCAQTGTGKTAAFALPILHNLMLTKKSGEKKIRSLILTPTRELAIQIFESFKSYGRNLPLKATAIFGGVSAVPQIDALEKGIDVLIATPGRLWDLITQKKIDLSFVQIFVLDEADRMLDMGFVHDVKRIIGLLPNERQTLFFSATMPPEINSLVASILKNPVKVAVTPISSTVDTIEQSVYFVDKDNKQKLLIHLLKNAEIVSALVFTRTKHGADKVVKELVRAGIAAAAIHGNKSQGARQTALQNFKSGEIRVLVATDIAARGIDIDELSHVFNYDLPNIPETYVHRIGRTGRAGLGGIAIAFCNIEEKEYLNDIEQLINKQVPVVKEHPYPMQIFTIAPKEKPQPRPSRSQGDRPRNAKTEEKAKRFDSNSGAQGRPFAGGKGKGQSSFSGGGRTSQKKAPPTRGHVKKG